MEAEIVWAQFAFAVVITNRVSKSIPVVGFRAAMLAMRNKGGLSVDSEASTELMFGARKIGFVVAGGFPETLKEPLRAPPG